MWSASIDRRVVSWPNPSCCFFLHFSWSCDPKEIFSLFKYEQEETSVELFFFFLWCGWTIAIWNGHMHKVQTRGTDHMCCLCGLIGSETELYLLFEIAIASATLDGVYVDIIILCTVHYNKRAEIWHLNCWAVASVLLISCAIDTTFEYLKWLVLHLSLCQWSRWEFTSPNSPHTVCFV